MPMPAISKIEIARLEANFAGCKPREDRWSRPEESMVLLMTNRSFSKPDVVRQNLNLSWLMPCQMSLTTHFLDVLNPHLSRRLNYVHCDNMWKANANNSMISNF
jgi:hypothetical protein